ncbi:TIGR02680 family protein [Streptomyces sp. NPDC086554]|uniref:TIGR02680 family protein n=1 Tax=Streptomyces sp. NPDC086554 TaxID=3154864 RepID=UPI0034457405
MTTPPALPTAHARLQRLLDGQLPIPGRTRFQPLRMGLIGIWQYEEDEFLFHDGRLILTGRNGSGKSKVLEVSSPFLLDANLTPRRLDPFGTSGRTMRDNLLYDGRGQRLGYIWCEYGRVADDGTFEYVTIGAGLKALETKKGAPDRWFFATSQRIGDDFALYNTRRQPHSMKRLKEVLGQACVFESATDYQQHLSKHLFGFASVAQLRSLVNLLLTLRRPKLSEDFSVDKLTGLLTDGLPPVDPRLLDDLARRFDELAREREEMQRHTANREALRQFHTAYQSYARTMVAHGADVMGATRRALDRARARRTEAGTALENIHEQLADLTDRQRELTTRRIRHQARVTTLGARPEVKQAAVLDLLGRAAEQARRYADEAAGHARAAEASHDEARQDWTHEQIRVAEATEALHERERHAEALAESSGLRDDHARQRARLRGTPDGAAELLDATIHARQKAVLDTHRLIDATEGARLRHDTAHDHHKTLEARRDDAEKEGHDRQKALKDEAELLRQAVIDWADSLEELVVDERQLGALVAAMDGYASDRGPTLPAAADAAAQSQRTSIEERRANLKARRAVLTEERDRLREDRERVVAENDPEPPAPAVRRRPRDLEAREDGAPLWRLVDFAEDTPQHVRALLEAALYASGMLDAWVTPGGRLLAADTLETVLVAGSVAPAPTLADTLTPVAHPSIGEDTVRSLLGGVGLHTPGDADCAGTWIGTDGSWRNGPLHGRTEADHASYIGVAARQAERRRRLTLLDDRLRAQDEQIAAVDAARTEATARLDRMTDERNRLPSQQPLIEAGARLATAQGVLKGIDAEVKVAQERLHDRLVEYENADRALRHFARTHRTSPRRAELRVQETALHDYRTAVVNLTSAADRWQQRQEAETKARKLLDERESDLARRREEHQRLEDDAQDKETRLTTERAAVGPGAKTVLEDLARARTDLQATDDALTTLLDTREKVVGNRGLAEGDQQRAEGDVTVAIGEHATSRAQFQALHTLGLLELASLPDAAPQTAVTDEVLDAHAGTARQHLSGLSDAERNHDQAQTALHRAFRTLEAGIAGPDWRPVQETRANILHVTVLHNGTPLGVVQTLATMDHEIDTRHSLVDEEEHKLFSEVLLGRIGNHLSQRRAEATNLVDRMNELLAARPTATNLLMELDWDPDPEQSQDVHDAITALDGRFTQTLADRERDRLIDFLADRVRAAREQDGAGDWKSHLSQALDYRRWSRFTIKFKKDGARMWSKLTDKKHQKGSGGEKAVMLQLPLFIAAAAHYRAAARHAPRPVYLDEAFAGIDTEMRGDCMGLLTDLDLDVVMASHDENGFHRQVPGVATYHLFRDPEISGVLATPLLWDGAEQRQHEMTDAALYGDAATDVVFVGQDDDPYDGDDGYGNEEGDTD